MSRLGWLLFLLLWSQITLAEPPPFNPFQVAGFDQNLGAQVATGLEFTDDVGHAVRLKNFFNNKPVVLALAYYRCPNLCLHVLEGMAESLQAVDFKAGRDYEVVIVGIDPNESWEAAAAKKAELAAHYPRADVGAWHLLTGQEPQIKQFADQVGFRYAYDEKLGQYVHAAGLMLLTDQGVVSRYFFGVRFPAQGLRLGLVETAGGKIGNPVDHLLLLCYDYNPVTGQYGLLITNVLRLAGAMTVGLLGMAVGVMLLRERRSRAQARRHPSYPQERGV